MHPAAPLQANQRFGRYTLVSPIAVGGMAEVWLAKLDGPHGFEKRVALKRMIGALAEQPQFVSMFLDEARLMSRLSHPNIAQVFELGELDESFYVAMEFIDGQTVQHTMRAVVKANSRLPVELAVKIARDAADGLAYAHTRTDDDGRPLNIIHRDVSPQNLMVTYAGVPKLLDFGIAKAATRSSATEAGQLRGKLSYMPPEQARGELIDARADQFSLGVTLFEMLTHTRLYPPMKEMDLFRHVATREEPYETARQREPSVPEELSALVARMMSREASDRFPSMADVRDRLTAYLHAASTSIPSNEALAHFMTLTFPPAERALKPVSAPSVPSLVPVDPTPSLGDRDRGWRRLAAVLAAVVAAVGAMAAVVWSSLSSPEPTGVDAGVVAALEPPRPAPKPVEPSGPVEAVTPEPDPEEDEPELPAIDAGVPVKARAKGKLSLVTSPWSNVYFGKKNLGETPLVNVPMPAGKHRLLLINDERKLRKTIEVEIKPGKPTSLKLKL